MVFNDGDNGGFMSVLIKNMVMPENCMHCPFPAVGTDAFYCHCPTMDGKEYDFEHANRRPFDCPLVELPEHHGRLIDADRLMRVYEDRLEKVADRYGVDSSEAGILSGAMKLLMIELGIVKAE